MKQLKTLMSTLMLLALPLLLTGCEDLFGEWDKPTPVTPAPLVSKTPGSISYETTSFLKGSLDPSFTNTLTLTGDGTVTYTSSDPSVATVDATTGKVTPVAPGTVTITATVSDSGNYTYATNQVSYFIVVQDGYTYREWNVGEQKYETKIVPSSMCQLITPSTSLGHGIYVVKGNVTVNNNMNTDNTAPILLCDNSTLNINGCLYVTGTEQHNLGIYAQSEGENMGKLNVTASTAPSGVSGVICNSTTNGEITIHGGKITATATGTTIKLHGICCGRMTIYGGDIKGQGNDTDNEYYGSNGIYVYPNLLTISGGKVEGIGGKNLATSGYRAGDGICGKYDISGDAIVIGTGGDGNSCIGGYGINDNTLPSIIRGRAVVTVKGGNSYNFSGGFGMLVQGGVEIKDNAQVIATGGNSTGANYSGGTAINNGTINLKDQASLTAKAGNGTGSANGADALWANLNYYGGTFTAVGGAKGPSGANNGSAINSSKYFKNQATETVSFEYSNDGETWTSFDITAGNNATPTQRYVRKTN